MTVAPSGLVAEPAYCPFASRCSGTPPFGIRGDSLCAHGSLSVVDDSPSSGDRTLAVVCQLWCWLGPLAIVPLVVRFTSARHSTFLRAVTGEVLNLQLVVAALAGGGVGAILAGLDLIALSLWACFAIVATYGYIVGVIAAVRAWRGHAWLYPVNLHVISR